MDRMVALKLIHQSMADNDQVVQRFHREMQASSKIEHPNTIQVYDFGQTDEGQLFLAMEFLPGRPLTKLIDGQALPLQRLVHIGQQITRALGAAHQAGIVHRDLKPDNVMMVERYGEPDFVKVLDFGIARTLDESRTHLTQDGAVIGTPTYMSPEQATGRPVDARSDLYSLGVMLFQMATGQVPFKGETPISLLAMHAHEPPPPPSTIAAGIDTRLEALILALLAKAPEERPQTAAEVEARLGNLVTGTPDDQQTLHREQKPEQAPSSMRWLLVGAGVLGAVALVLVAAVLLRKPAVEPERQRPPVERDLGQLRAAIDAALRGGGDPRTPESCRAQARGEKALLLLSASARSLDPDKHNAPGDAQTLEALVAGEAAASGSAEYWALRSRAELFAGKPPADARASAEKAISLCPDLALAHNAAGNAAQKAQQYEAAQASYEKSLQLAPDYAAPQLNLALLSLRQKKPQLAVARLDGLIGARPDTSGAHRVRGLAHATLGHVDQAIADLAEATRRAPDDADAWVLLGKLRTRSKSPDAAQDAFCKAKALGNSEGGKLCTRS
jgi:serine/threonine-protein kinase